MNVSCCSPSATCFRGRHLLFIHHNELNVVRNFTADTSWAISDRSIVVRTRHPVGHPAIISSPFWSVSRYTLLYLLNTDSFKLHCHLYPCYWTLLCSARQQILPVADDSANLLQWDLERKWSPPILMLSLSGRLGHDFILKWMILKIYPPKEKLWKLLYPALPKKIFEV